MAGPMTGASNGDQLTARGNLRTLHMLTVVHYCRNACSAREVNLNESPVKPMPASVSLPVMRPSNALQLHAPWVILCFSVWFAPLLLVNFLTLPGAHVIGDVCVMHAQTWR